MKSSQTLLLLISLLLALATVLDATSREPRRHRIVEANFIVVDTEPKPEPAVAAPEPSASMSSPSVLPPLILLGFLTVIGGMLFHWSKDSSCNQERSVF